MNAAIIAFSERGCALGEQIVDYFAQRGDMAGLTRCPSGGLAEWTKAHFHHDALIFIGACGIAVRAIAPFLAGKTKDPAVVVIDELGIHVVSLLSGHTGGANHLTVSLADFLQATPVITSATDVHGIFAIDTWAAMRGIRIANPEHIKGISGRLLAGETIAVNSIFPVAGPLPDGFRLGDHEEDVLISCFNREDKETLQLIPPVVTLGIGCKKDVPVESIEEAFEHTLKKANCHPLAIERVCSIRQKEKEPGILEFCRRKSFDYQTFSVQELMAVPGTYTSSGFVKEITGVDNVCERSAVLGSGAGGQLLLGKTALNGVTMALAISPYTISFEEADEV
ncbi:MAG: cobalamin biosynthesis protein CbiG [Syntrophomonadaceae bacterium]|nr:cobalamin biosynthesis protein CbiG [Syntrophomonadaceae bacterium]